MSKTKNWLWDEAENFVEKIACQVKSGVLTFDQGLKEIMNNQNNYALELVGIEDEDNASDYLYYAIND